MFSDKIEEFVARETRKLKILQKFKEKVRRPVESVGSDDDESKS